MTRASFVIFLGSLLATTAALATTYVRVEKDGTKTYSDRPLPGGQPVDMQPAQTYSAPATPASQNSNRPREEQALNEAANFRYQCALAPRERRDLPESGNRDAECRADSRTARGRRQCISAWTAPRCRAGEIPTSATLTLPERGTHTATVRIIDRYGKTVCDASSTFHVQRTSLNSPQRRPPPRPTQPRPTPH